MLHQNYDWPRAWNCVAATVHDLKVMYMLLSVSATLQQIVLESLSTRSALRLDLCVYIISSRCSLMIERAIPQWQCDITVHTLFSRLHDTCEKTCAWLNIDSRVTTKIWGEQCHVEHAHACAVASAINRPKHLAHLKQRFEKPATLQLARKELYVDILKVFDQINELNITSRRFMNIGDS